MRIFLILIISLFISACSLPGMHKIDIQQGNYIDDSRIQKLKVGQTKKEVQLILGTPVLQDPYHPDQWKYIYALYKSGTRLEQERRLTVYFKDDKLDRFTQE